MLLSINPDALWLRAYIHVDEVSDDCLSLCTDCPPEEICPEITFDGTPNYTAILGSVESGGHSGDALKRTGHYSEFGGTNNLWVQLETSVTDCAANRISFWIRIDWGTEYERAISYYLETSEGTLLYTNAVSPYVPERTWTQRTITLDAPLDVDNVKLRIGSGAEGQDGDLRIDDILFYVE
jgi:hypothetical protein